MKTLALMASVAVLGVTGCAGTPQEEIDAQIAAAVDAAVADAEAQFQRELDAAVADALADIADAQNTAAQEALTAAVDECGLGRSPFVQVDDAGLMLDGEVVSGLGVSYDDTMCVLSELDIPRSLVMRMDNTNANMGSVDGEWGPYRATWSNDPDTGFDVFVDVAD